MNRHVMTDHSLVEGHPNRTAIRGHVGADWAPLATASRSPVHQADQSPNDSARNHAASPSGGEGGILLPPLPESTDESYTSEIIPCV